MIELAIAYPREPAYARVSSFAQRVYRERIALTVTRQPDVFIFAQGEVGLLGCMGLYRGDTHPKLLFEHCDPPHVYERLAGNRYPDHAQCGELGNRVTAPPETAHVDTRVVSTAITALACIVAHAYGIRYLGAITTPLVRAMTRQIGFELVPLGAPDFSEKDAAFRENMHDFLEGRPICAGIRLHSVAGCHAFLKAQASAMAIRPGPPLVPRHSVA